MHPGLRASLPQIIRNELGTNTYSTHTYTYIHNHCTQHTNTATLTDMTTFRNTCMQSPLHALLIHILTNSTHFALMQIYKMR